MEKIIYVCDRCGRESLEDRKGWEVVRFKRNLRDSVGDGLLCNICIESLLSWFNNKPTGVTFISETYFA